MLKRSGIVAAFAGLLVAALAAGPAELRASDCGTSDRLGISKSECLSGGHRSWDHYFHRKGKAWAQTNSDCWAVFNYAPSRYDSVWVKVDRSGATDWTWELDNTNKRERTGNAGIRGVWCCKDKGMCNRSDVVNSDGCKERFLDGVDNFEGCSVDSSSGSGGDCTITATCEHEGESVTTTVTDRYAWTDNYEVVDGTVRQVPVVTPGCPECD